MMKRVAWVFLAVSLAVSATLEARADDVAVAFQDVPTTHAGGVLPVSAVFAKPPTVAERRLVFIAQARRLTDDAVIATTVEDNGGIGYTGLSAAFDLDFPIPADAGAIYFVGWAVPWSLNRAVVEKYRSYPTDGTFKYAWVSNSYGVTRDVYYLNALIAPTLADHSTYCSGITFETFVFAFADYNTANGHDRIGAMTVSDMRAFRTYWYGATSVDREKLTAYAIPKYNLGVEVPFDEVQEGDFVQFWRQGGSGHSVVFVDWERDGQDNITGFRYWSSQTSSDGVGYGTEYFGETSGVNRARFWPARLRKPRDAADFAWALGSASTRDAPTLSVITPGNSFVVR